MYDRALEVYIGLNTSTHELSQTEIENRMKRNYTVQVNKKYRTVIILFCYRFHNVYLPVFIIPMFSPQFQDFTCVNLKDYKVCVVVSFCNYLKFIDRLCSRHFFGQSLRCEGRSI